MFRAVLELSFKKDKVIIMVKVAPSILTSDFISFESELKNLEKAGVKILHLDVMDGIFVPNISFGNPVIKSIKAHTDMILDVHLMIDRPHRYIEEFAKYADIISFHYEAGSNNAETLKRIRELGVKSAIAIKPKTKPEEIYDLLPLCDMVLVMSVEPGFGGQKFMPSANEKLKKLKAKCEELSLSISLEVDGGINGETAESAAKAGADILVAGSYIIGSADMKERVKFIESL